MRMSLWPLMRLPKTCERRAHDASTRCSMTSTKPPPNVGKNAAVPFTARASIDARMNPSTASNAVFCERKRRSPQRTMISVAAKTTTPRRLICTNVSAVASRPSPSVASTPDIKPGIHLSRTVMEAEWLADLSRGRERIGHEPLRLGDNRLQVRFVFEALRVDLVDVLGP